MAFTLKIQSKTLFGNKKVDFEQLIKNCGLNYGHDNEFYILEEGMREDTAILYNPNRIGRGIFFDGSGMKEGKVEISYNIPTTEAEIVDFINVVKELNRQMKKVEMFCVEEERKYTLEQLIDNKDNMVRFCLEKLNEFCSNNEYTSYIFTLAFWPYELTNEMVKTFANCTDLHEFEQTLHMKQNMDVYYAKPRFYRKENGEIFANYVFTEECESVFPIKADAYFRTERIGINEGYICYYIFSEERMMDGAYDYDKFIQYVMDNGAEYYDGSHIIVPAMTKEQMEEMAKVIKSVDGDNH